MAHRFEIDDKIRRQYSRYNAVGTQLTVRLLPPADNSDPVGHFLASVKEHFEYAWKDVSDDDMVGITIHNQVNQNDKPIGIRFRRKDQLSGEVIWSVFEKVSQSNTRFNALDTLVVTVHSEKMTWITVSARAELCHGQSQVEYCEGEGRGKLFSPRYNNSDCESR